MCIPETPDCRYEVGLGKRQGATYSSGASTQMCLLPSRSLSCQDAMATSLDLNDPINRFDTFSTAVVAANTTI